MAYPSDAFLASILPAAQFYAAPQASMPPPVASQDAMLAQMPMSASPPAAFEVSQTGEIGPPLPNIPQPGAHLPPAPEASLQRFAPPSPSPEAVAAALRPPPGAPAPFAPPPPAPPPAEPTKPKIIMSPGQAIPAREVPLAGPTQMALVNTAFGAQQEANALRTEGQRTSALREGMQAQVQLDQALAQQQAAEERMRAMQTHLAQTQDSMNADASALAQDKITMPAPNIGAVIGVALSAFAHGYSGGKVQNLAWDIVRKRMDDDLAVQQANHQSKRAAFDAKQRQFQNLVQTYGMDPAKDLWSAAQREKVAAETRLMASSSSLPQIQAEGEARAKDLEAEAMKLRASAFVGYQKATATGPQYFVRGQSGELIMIPVSQAKAFEAEYKNQEQAAARIGKREERQADFEYDVAKEAAKEKVKGHHEGEAKRKEAVSAGQSIISTIDRVLTLKRGTGFAERTLGKAGLPSDDIGRIEGDVAAIHGSYGRFKGTGVYDEGTARLLDKMTGNPAEMWGTSEAKLRELRANVVRDLTNIGGAPSAAGPKIDEAKP